MKGFTYALQSLHLTIGFVPYDTDGIGSPYIYIVIMNIITVDNSPNGLTMTPIGIATSFCKLLDIGILSVVTLINDFSVLNSSNTN